MLAFVSLALVSLATHRQQPRGVFLGCFGTLVAIATYIPAAFVAEVYF